MLSQNYTILSRHETYEPYDQKKHPPRAASD